MLRYTFEGRDEMIALGRFSDAFPMPAAPSYAELLARAD
jgi:hypothetical protein